MRSNQSKALARSGKPAIGIMCNAASPLTVESLGHAGYDFAVIDMQHGETNLSTLQNMLQALSLTSATPMVRIPANIPMYIQRALDLGAYGVIVPMVNARKEAEEVVASVRYAPNGNRSWGPVLATMYGGVDYFSKSADELLTLVMLETAEGLRNAREILNVPGIDGCFIGPADLNISLGYSPDDPDLAQETEESIARICEVAHAVGKIVGGHTFSVENAKVRIAQGFRFVTVMADTRMLRASAAQVLSALKP
jgi:4-hydroxy-2-oxoheptanedioate aldolase